MQLLLPWRFFRLWALTDGLDPPENMVRCMANNYSALGFWGAVHRSYNLWIVRFLYIPLGGARRLAATSVLIFTFVALWHGLSPRLLAWGWLAALFILPEGVAREAVLSSLGRGHASPLANYHLLMSSLTVWGRVVVPSCVRGRRGVQRPTDDGR